MSITLNVLEKPYSIYQLISENIDVKALWNQASELFFISKTAKEISVIAESGTLSSYHAKEEGWVALEIQGTITFDVSGTLHSLLDPLAKKNLSVLAISAYSTDYIFIKQDFLPQAIQALQERGFSVVPPTRVCSESEILV